MPKQSAMKLLAAVAFFSIAQPTAWAESFNITGSAGSNVSAHPIASFNKPWAMTFLDESHMLVTTKPGKLWLVTVRGKKVEVGGVPDVVVGGQGGLGDIVTHPDYGQNKLVYLSYVDSTDNGKTRGAVVVRGRLEISNEPELRDIEIIWSQTPKRRAGGHFSHRIAFGHKGSEQEGKLFITSGDRQEQTPAQNWDMALGKIIRLNDDGSIPADNPFQTKGALAKTYWTTGHRNLLGIAFDQDNRLWSHEMGPRHGDELNHIKPGLNYGWPVVSNGDNYNGSEIPDHDTRPEFEAPKAYWVPSIAPSGLVIYSSEPFSQWQGNALIGGLVSKALIRVSLNGDTATEVERFRWGKRIREVEQGPKGAVWVLEDRSGGRLLKITPN